MAASIKRLLKTAEMRIKFKTKRLVAHLILGLAWLSLGFFVLLFYDDPHWSYYAYMVLGLLYIGNYLYDSINQYLSIKNGTIYKNGLFRKKKTILLKDVRCVRMYAGDLIIKTDHSEMRINTELIQKNSLIDLKELLEELDLEAGKTHVLIDLET